MLTPSPDGDYTVTTLYSGPDDAWYVELDVVDGQRALVTAIVPDEDPTREPTVCFDPRGRHLDVPYRVMRWFMDLVEEEIRTSRAWMRLRPELVEVIHGLRQEYLGVIGDDEFPRVLAEVRSAVPEADLPAVLAAAFGRRPDGTTMDDVQALLPPDGQVDGT
ncbi:hypothetical protein [Streptomyces resistomycificus]|uniref:Uncharacterized protein n=1 Tax=Streptomyces resistomycificus TaxID=67356 RepID=A0A0L8LW95_9ACTN|nr:hypothetical protein [Streptomyces resistomycificus]KOG42453.1 hypothetical protein ADK37_04830 [Streptomyces resistomycificus]KUN92604.1 hypothetical protein AQJ84_31935 [Streptomyces resistomycificus]